MASLDLPSRKGLGLVETLVLATSGDSTMRTISRRRLISRRSVVAGTLAAPLILSAREAFALDKVRFGKSVPNSFAFSTAEIGTDAKIWQTENIELAVSAFRGDAQMQQALTAGAVDVALGSGPGLGFRAGGVPARLAAMERGELDGMVIESATSYELEEQGKGRTITLFGDIEKHFYTH